MSQLKAFHRPEAEFRVTNNPQRGQVLSEVSITCHLLYAEYDSRVKCVLTSSYPYLSSMYALISR